MAPSLLSTFSTFTSFSFNRNRAPANTPSEALRIGREGGGGGRGRRKAKLVMVVVDDSRDSS